MPSVGVEESMRTIRWEQITLKSLATLQKKVTEKNGTQRFLSIQLH